MTSFAPLPASVAYIRDTPPPLDTPSQETRNSLPKAQSSTPWITCTPHSDPLNINSLHPLTKMRRVAFPLRAASLETPTCLRSQSQALV